MDIFALVLESDEMGGEFLSVFKIVEDNGHHWQYRYAIRSKRDAFAAIEKCSIFFESKGIFNVGNIESWQFNSDMSAVSGIIDRLF